MAEFGRYTNATGCDVHCVSKAHLGQQRAPKAAQHRTSRPGFQVQYSQQGRDDEDADNLQVHMAVVHFRCDK